MGWIIFSGVVLLIALVAALVYLKASEPQVKIGGLLAGVGVVALWGIVTVFCSYNSIDPGNVGVTSFAGKIDYDGYLTEGPQFVAPWKSVTPYEAHKRHYVEVGSNDKLETIVCGDDKQVEVNLTFGYSINPHYAPRLLRHFKPDQLDQLAATAARAATRNVFIAENAKDVYGGKTKVVDKLQVEFEFRMAQQLHGLDAFAGMTEEQLKDVFSVLPVQAENTLPPARVRTAMNENQAAAIELERQKTLTEVAEQAAARMSKEGVGLKNVISELPKDTSLRDAADLIRAVADMRRAKAIEQAVEEGKIPVIYLDGNSGHSGGATVPAAPSVSAPNKK